LFQNILYLLLYTFHSSYVYDKALLKGLADKALLKRTRSSNQRGMKRSIAIYGNKVVKKININGGKNIR
jgi:hypothetical protein